MNLSWEIRGSRYESIGGEPRGGLRTTKTADKAQAFAFTGWRKALLLLGSVGPTTLMKRTTTMSLFSSKYNENV